MVSQTVNWRNLPSDLLNSIATRLPNRFHIQKLRAVCPEWHSSIPAPSSANNKALSSLIKLPLGDSNKCQRNDSHDVYISTFYKLTPLTAEGSGLSCVVEVVDVEHDGKVRLVDPIGDRSFIRPFETGMTVNLLEYDIVELGKCCKPAEEDYYGFEKIIVCDDNTTMVRLNYFYSLIYSRLVDDQWTFDVRKYRKAIFDITSYKGGVCVLEESGRALLFLDQNLESKEIASPLFDCSWRRPYAALFLVQSSSGLLLVQYIEKSSKVPYYEEFKVYKLNENIGKWVELDNLDGKILFLQDTDCSFLLCSADFDGYNDNCVVYSRRPIHNSPTLVYNLGDRIVCVISK